MEYTDWLEGPWTVLELEVGSTLSLSGLRIGGSLKKSWMPSQYLTTITENNGNEYPSIARLGA